MQTKMTMMTGAAFLLIAGGVAAQTPSAPTAGASTQQAQTQPGAQGGRGQAAPITPGVCPAETGPRGGPAGVSTGPAAPKRVLAWADSRNGRAQHEYVSYALAQLQRMGHDSGAYNVIIRTDSDIISFNPTMTDGKTPASGGPNLCNIDAIIYAGHRNVPLSPQQKADLISALKDKGVGFVTLFIGMLPDTDFPELAKIEGQVSATVDVHDPWSGGSTLVNESPDSPFTKHYPKIWNEPNGAVYQPTQYDRSQIQVLLRKDLSKLPANYKYTRTDGDYPAAYIKMYGKSRVFVSSLGNSEPLWDNKDLLTMYDQAIKWSVGLVNYEVKPHPLPADVKPPIGPIPPPPPPGAGRGGRGAPPG